MRRILAIVVAAAAGSLIGLYSAVAFMDRDPPIILKSSHVVTPQVAPGGTLKVDVEIFRTRRCETTVDRIIFDGAGARHVLEPVNFTSSGGARGEERYLNLAPIPADAAPGAARYRSIGTYRCNTLHRSWPIVGEPREVDFEIVAP